MSDRSSKRFKIRHIVSDERMSAADYEAAERILARLVARRFAMDHPELFGPHLGEVLGIQVSVSVADRPGGGGRSSRKRQRPGRKMGHGAL